MKVQQKFSTKDEFQNYRMIKVEIEGEPGPVLDLMKAVRERLGEKWVEE